MSDGSRVQRFAVPPSKIACGFYHSLAISNSQWVDERASHDAKKKEGEAAKVQMEEEHVNADDMPVEVFSWGGNEHHQVGHPSKIARTTKGAKDPDVLWPQKIECETLKDYGVPYQVSAGARHSVFLMKKPNELGGRLFAAGLGLRGRLGMSNPEDESGDHEIEDAWSTEKGPIGPIPVMKNKLPLQVLRVDCGADHTLLFCVDGKLYAFGANKSGQCGVGDFKDVRTARPVHLPSETAIHHFAAGAEHSLAAIGDGQIWSWGCGKNGRLGLGLADNINEPAHAAAIGEVQALYVACGEAHSGMIDNRGKIWAWGAGSYGRLGTGEEDDVQVPRFIDAFEEMTDPPGQIKFTMIAFGGFHSLFLEEPEAISGRLFSCGAGHAVGLLGEGDHSSILEPRHIADSSLGSKGMIKQVAAGTYHNLVLLENGELVRWGSGANGRLGHYDGRVKATVSPETSKNFRGFAMKPDFAAMHITVDDKMHNYTHATERQPRKKKQDGDKQKKSNDTVIDVQQVACGALHTMTLIAGGQIYLWGSNASGQLGIGVGKAEVCERVPRKLPIPNNRRVKEIAAGYEHCIVVTFNAECWAWGKGASGQLGTGRARDAVEPTQITALQQVLTCSAGEEHSAAICMISGGHGGKQLYTFGSAENGKLGLGEDFMSGPQSTPMPVNFDLGDAIPAQSRGRSKAKAKGKSKASKTSTSATDALWPQKVKCGLGHTAVIVGRFDNPQMHKEEENMVFTFGAGWFGRLGLNEKANQYSPKKVKFPDDYCAQDIQCGGYHTACLSTDGELYMWGRKDMVLEQDDIMSPQKFNAIEGNPELKAVACGETHTLAVTSRGDVFAWGKNKSGQLGLDHFTDVGAPEECKGLPGNCLLLASGSGHSVAVNGTGDVYAWGNQTCGRLGLAGSFPEKYIAVPNKVFAEWASIASMTMNASESREQARTLDDMFPDDAPMELQEEKPPSLDPSKPGSKVREKMEDPKEENEAKMLKVLGKQKVKSFATMQMLIKQEKEGSRPAKLKQLEEDLKGRFNSALDDIKRIPQEEAAIKAIEGDLQQSLESNLRYFKVNSPEIGLGKIAPKFVDVLPTYETLLWVLQLQVMYMTELAHCMKTNEERRIVFYRIVISLYADAAPRTTGLFLMLLRRIISNEIEHTTKLTVDKAFDQESSRAFWLFKNYCLSQVHWVDLVHKYMKATPVTTLKDGVPSLFTAFKLHQDSGDGLIFTISAADYKEALIDVGETGGKDRDPDQEYPFALSAFQDWMTHEFLKSVMSVTLPQDVRILLNYFKNDIESRQPGLSKGHHEDVPEEQLNALPLLYFFCHGILVPMLRNPDKFAGKEVLLQQGGDVDVYLRSNMKRCAMFLEKMVDDTWEEKETRLLGLGNLDVKIKLLKYLQRQADIQNDLEARILVNTYKAHYDRSPQIVTFSVSDLMRLSNMLKFYDSHLRINQNDEMAELVRQLPKWTDDEIEHHQNNDRQYNFNMKTRFFFSEPEIAICPVSQILMPSRMCCSGGAPGFFRVYEAGGTDDPRKALEILFGELDTLKATTFAEMKGEFQDQRLAFRTTATPQYELMQRLQDGLRIVEELENGQAYPEDVLAFMSNSLIARDGHYNYLKMIDSGLKDMQGVTKKQYWAHLHAAKREVDRALDSSRGVKLPNKIIDAAGMNRNMLKFVALQDQLKKRAFEPDNAKDLKLAYTPIREYEFKKLVKMGVIDKKLFPPYDDEKMKQGMRVTVQAKGEGGIKLIVSIIKKKNVTNIKTLNITETALQEMKNVKEGGTAELKNEGESVFMICYAGEFLKLTQSLGKQTV